MGKRILVWFRNDLRLHDNEVLNEAVAKADEILPVYIFDPRQFKETHFHTQKTGVIRTQFIQQSVSALNQSFQNFGGELLVLSGLPEILIPQLVTEHGINEVYHHREVAREETMVSTAVEDALWKLKVNLRHFIGHTLYNKEDLPFPIKDIPDVFTQFKKKVERDATVKPCFNVPEKIDFVALSSASEIPSLTQLYGEDFDSIYMGSEFTGGEQEALNHLDLFIANISSISLSKKTEVYSKISPWLALGCISPRQVYWTIKILESHANYKQVYSQIVLGLLWRDYFRFMFKKHGNKFFMIEGFSTEKSNADLVNQISFDSWKTASTSSELVNLLMSEFNETGYLTNSARQVVSTYLVHELGVNWLYGAAYFEEKLIDYCPASNWGNWANMSGVGNDQKLSHTITFDKVAKGFDAKAVLSQLASV